jgi:hypothetical protein
MVAQCPHATQTQYCHKSKNHCKLGYSVLPGLFENNEQRYKNAEARQNETQADKRFIQAACYRLRRPADLNCPDFSQRSLQYQ